MTLRTLEVFIQVAQSGKMSIAAKKLYVSQSSVSQAITEIEKEFHVLLFERVRKKLILTPIGQQLLEYAKQAVSYQNSITEWLKQCSEYKYLRVGATVTVGSSVLSEIMKQLADAFPGLDSHVYVGNTHSIETQLLNGELDIGLVEGSISSEKIESHAAMDDYMVVVCGRNHRFFGRETISINELSGENFIFRESGSGTRAQAEQLLNNYNIPFKSSWECSNIETIKQAVIDGHGISAISERLVHRECDAGLMWACNVDGHPMQRHFSLVTKHDKIITDVLNSFKEIVYSYAENERAKRHMDAHTHLITLS
ncbi:MAG: LysR family transcriptional regulator [Firmicutes bacterium HGW-Firmicutes-16]|nr:MAG: LysR family transcriptional regulator [Firmicutes bacterium HGW-Firmicutes-16]